MKFPKFSSVIFSVFFLLLTGCKKDKESVIYTDAVIRPGSGEYYFKQAQEVSSTQEKIGSLNRGLAAVKNQEDSILPYLLNFKIFYHNQLKEYDSSLHFTDRLLEVASFQKDTLHLAEGYYRKARIYYYLKNNKENFKNAFEARRYYLALGDSSWAGRRTLEMANAQLKSGDVIGSQESATEALRYLNNKSDSSYISSSFNVIGIAYRDQGFYQDAISEYHNALRFSSSRIDSFPHLNNIAVVEKDLKNYNSAIAIWEKLIAEIDPSNKNDLLQYKENLTFARWLKDPAVDVETDFLETLEAQLLEGDLRGLLSSYYHLSEFFTEKDKIRAMEYSGKYLETARLYESATDELNALERLIPLAPVESLRDYAVRFIELNDSINAANLQSKNFFAKIKFDEERKQKEIVGLKTQNTLQKLETQNLRTRSFIGVLAGLLLILGFFFLLYYFRQRHKKHEIREVHKTESRISKVIHDELANDIFNIMSSLEPVAPVPVIDKLEKIYMRTRDISRENREIDTGENYVDYLKAILSNNTPDDSKLIVSGENSVNWDNLKEEKKIVIYRVLQELMINMKKHSGAKLVAISFAVSNKTLSIRYSDNGCGTLWKPSKKGSGLQNVENRISSLNGNITFESQKGKGFKIDMQIPV